VVILRSNNIQLIYYVAVAALQANKTSSTVVASREVIR